MNPENFKDDYGFAEYSIDKNSTSHFKASIKTKIVIIEYSTSISTLI